MIIPNKDILDKAFVKTGIPDYVWPWIAGALSACVMLFWRLRYLKSQGYIHELVDKGYGYTPHLIERAKQDFIILAVLITLNLLILIPSLHAARKLRGMAGRYQYLYLSILGALFLTAAIAQPPWILWVFEKSKTQLYELIRIYPFMDLWIGTNLAFLLLASASHLDEMLAPRRSFGAGAFLFCLLFVIRMGQWWKGWQLSLVILLLAYLYLGLEWKGNAKAEINTSTQLGNDPPSSKNSL